MKTIQADRKDNFFGHPIVIPLQIVRSKLVAPELKYALEGIVKALGAKASDQKAIVKAVLNPPANVETDTDYELYCSKILHDKISSVAMRSALRDRTRIIAKQLSPYIKGKSLLDIGCGDGTVAWDFNKKVDRLVLTDVVDYIDPEIRKLVDFRKYDDGNPLPVKEIFDTVIIVAVLHHSENPRALLELACQHARRLIIIESVFVNDPNRQIYCGCPGRSKEEQLAFAVFVDWLYNRVVHQDVPVPYNFTTPEHWISLLEENDFDVKHQDDLGVDIHIVPEYHYLLCADRVEH